MADDVMTFPDTWENFEKHYGFHDIKQAYMFGNTRLIPSFRVQQWLDHIDDIKRKEQSQKNKMEVIAKLFGKELGEEFEIVTPNGRVRKVKFTAERGLLYYDRIENEWRKNYGFLNFLCEGKAVIVDD